MTPGFKMMGGDFLIVIVTIRVKINCEYSDVYTDLVNRNLLGVIIVSMVS